MKIERLIYRCLYASGLALLGCAGGDVSIIGDDSGMLFDADDYGPPIDAPEFAGFLSDAEKEEYCFDNPSSGVCSEIGEVAQAWKSAKFHGVPQVSQDFPCYATSDPGFCGFPVQKQVRWFLDSTGCLTDGNSVVARSNFIDAATTVPAASFIAGPGNSPVTFTNTTSNATVKFRCATAAEESANPSRLGLTSYANTHVQISDLPGTPGAAVQYHDANITIYTRNIITACGAGSAGGVARIVGPHEMGHALGFAHFTTGLMRAGFPVCGTPFPTQYALGMATALSIYSGSTSGGVNIVDGILSP